MPYSYIANYSYLALYSLLKRSYNQTWQDSTAALTDLTLEVMMTSLQLGQVTDTYAL